jgi:hypothetical protein
MIQTDVLNCGTGSVGTWFDGCKKTPKDFTKAFLLAPSANIDLADDDFDEAARALLIKKGQLIALNDALQITEGGAKNNKQTLPNKRELFVSQGLLKFMIEFEANDCLVKALHKLTLKKWQLLLLDSEGQLMFDNKNGKLNGFEIGLMDVDNETVNDGGSKIAMVNLNIQLTQNGTKGYNLRRSFIVSEEFYEINGVQDVLIAGITLAHATLKVSVVGGCDGSTPILGLAAANFRILNATTGDDITFTDVTDNNDGTYSFTGVAAAGDRTIQLYDDVNNSVVADIESTQFFQSNVLAVTLT